jgi:hypothetical protein
MFLEPGVNWQLTIEFLDWAIWNQNQNQVWFPKPSLDLLS